jgi:hypothetical protein
MFKYIWLIIPAVVYVILVGSLFYFVSKQENRTVRIDCTWVEISPDMPPKVKEECRKKLSGRI